MTSRAACSRSAHQGWFPQDVWFKRSLKPIQVCSKSIRRSTPCSTIYSLSNRSVNIIRCLTWFRSWPVTFSNRPINWNKKNQHWWTRTTRQFKTQPKIVRIMSVLIALCLHTWTNRAQRGHHSRSAYSRCPLIQAVLIRRATSESKTRRMSSVTRASTHCSGIQRVSARANRICKIAISCQIRSLRLP